MFLCRCRKLTPIAIGYTRQELESDKRTVRNFIPALIDGIEVSVCEQN